MIATSEAHGTSRPNDVVVSIRFPTGSGKPYTYFVESRFNVKIGDTVVVNTSRTPEAALQYVEVIDVIDDIFSVEGNHKRIVRVHKRSEARKLESPVVYPFLTGNGATPELGAGYDLDAINEEHLRKSYQLHDELLISTPRYESAADMYLRLAAARRPDRQPIGEWQLHNVSQSTISSASAQPQNLPKETTMIKLENRTYVNGADAASLTDDQLFELVIKTEADIEHLNGIEHKSEKVKLKIEQMRKSIRELNTYIDSRP